MNRPITVGIALYVVIIFAGLIDNADIWNWTSYFYGLITGLPIFYCWAANKKIGAVLSLVGFSLFFMLLFGLDVASDRVFFSGISNGLIVGLIPTYLFNRPRSYLYLKKTCAIRQPKIDSIIL